MNEVLVKENIKIEDMIYEIRGKQVMLDSDLARIYETETKRINEAVYRNKEKFPERLSWILDDNDLEILKSQIATPNLNEHGSKRYNIRAFTEEGVLLLATILKTKVATEVSIKIINAFVVMRKYISYNLLEQKYINNLVLEHDKRIKALEDLFQKLIENKNLTNKIKKIEED